KGRQCWAVHKTVLSKDEEEGIVQVILYRLKVGVCMTDGELRILARQIAAKAGKAMSKFFPSSRWPTCFADRHIYRLTLKKAQILATKSASQRSAFIRTTCRRLWKA
ncbi:hypothetical protein PPTG_24973, partial [Phytophthora nicotianae INRA-310]